VKTPRLYWLTIAVCALLGALLGWANARSGLDEKLRQVSADVQAAIIKESGRDISGAAAACEALFDSRDIAKGEVGQRMMEACKPYRDYRDYSAPKAFVFALFGAMIGLFVGMYVNKRLRTAGKARWWTDQDQTSAT
jgi:hypothetical protein